MNANNIGSAGASPSRRWSLDRVAVRDGVIQRFEFTFELLWKTVQLHLQHLGYEANRSRRVLREAFEAGIIALDQSEGN